MNANENGTGTIQLPSLKMWQATRTLARSLAEAIANETSLIKARKKQEKEIEELGRDPKTVLTEEWRTAAADLMVTKMAIDDARAGKVYFADKLQECVNWATNGRDYSDSELDQLSTPKAAPDAPLFEAAMKAAGLPAEGENKPDPLAVSIAPDASGADLQPGNDSASGPEWRYTLIEKLEEPKMRHNEQQVLRNLGLVSLGDIDRHVHTEGNDLMAVEGVSKKTKLALLALINNLRDAHEPKPIGDPEVAIGRRKKPKPSDALAAEAQAPEPAAVGT